MNITITTHSFDPLSLPTFISQICLYHRYTNLPPTTKSVPDHTIWASRWSLPFVDFRYCAGNTSFPPYHDFGSGKPSQRFFLTAVSMTSSKDPVFTNLSVLYSGECPRIDIVVVENLGETPFQSWTYQKEGRVVAWLQDPVFRVFSFSYEVTKKSYPRSLAKSLLQKLRKARLAGGISVSFQFHPLTCPGRRNDLSYFLGLASAESFA